MAGDDANIILLILPSCLFNLSTGIVNTTATRYQLLLKELLSDTFMKKLYFLLHLFSASLTAGVPADLVSAGPHPDAPEGIMEYGQLVGSWQCKGFRLQPDGSWKEAEGVNTWTWYFVLDGRAVQDVWKPRANTEGQVFQGTNLRTYDAETGIWNVAWTISSSARIETFISSYRDGVIHISAQRAANGVFPAHMMHIPFYNISGQHFDWKYETSALTDGKNWSEISRLSCDRDSGQAVAS